MTITEIAPAEAARYLENGSAVLVDVRTPVEFAAFHATPALNIPLDRLAEDALRTACGSKRLLFICQSGTRGGKACEAAAKMGFSPTNVTGGTVAWGAGGFSVQRGKQVMSLERQVRIAAGALVALGTLAAILVSNIFLAIPLIVGSGLVFAGITDTCFMGMQLAKMPWNQRPASACSTVPAKQ